MKKIRKHYTSAEKVNILKLHLLEGKPVSDLCDKYQLQPAVFYRWQKEFFENGATAFERVQDHGDRVKDRRIVQLEEKLHNKDEVLAE
jgi:Transposase.